MAPAKRKPRRKEHNGTSEIDLPESPAARPTTKKRKATGSRPSQKQRRISPQPSPPNDDSESCPDDADDAGNKDLVESVISYLQVASHPVVAVGEYANDKIDEAEKVTAYAKIAGRDWTYFVVGQSVNIGRPPDKDVEPQSIPPSSPLNDAKDLLPVHIDLGPSKYVSRHHACIFYDAEFPENGGWHLRVNGRNGVRVNNRLLKRGEGHQLTSGDVMEIAATQIMFVTPGDRAIIDPWFIDKAKMAASGEDWQPTQHAHPQTSSSTGDLPLGSQYPTMGKHQPLAPAPPHLPRAVTPPATAAAVAPVAPKDGRDQRGVFDSKPPPSPMYNRGMMMESTQDIDYSHDAAKDLKPPFSYATMIAQAIFSNEEEKLTLSNIYAWISERYAFYRHSNSGWQNSIRHNLSLNKAFQKVPRRTDEPGKGMKWQIAPEFRADYLKKQAKKGLPLSSSAPTSPAAPGSSKELAPNFRGPNGQSLGYDSRYVSQFPAVNAHPQLPAITPERRSRKNTQSTAPDPDLDPLGSPLTGLPHTSSPHHHRHDSGSPSKQPHYTLPPTMHTIQAQQLSQQSPARSTALNNHDADNNNNNSHDDDRHPPSNPTLSSSYLDTPFHSNHTTMTTPAPRKLQNIRLAPPSTLVAPSKFMAPDSSPAGPHSFWRGLMSTGGPGSLGLTPAGPVLDMSPVKQEVRPGGGRARPDGDEEDGAAEQDLMSSSPPPMDGPGASPTKRITAAASAIRFGGLGGPPGNDHNTVTPMDNGYSHGYGYGQARNHGLQGEANLSNAKNNDNNNKNDFGDRPAQVQSETKADNDDVDMDRDPVHHGNGATGIPDLGGGGGGGGGGFDLARGFQPIGFGASFSSATSAASNNNNNNIPAGASSAAGG